MSHSNYANPFSQHLRSSQDSLITSPPLSEVREEFETLNQLLLSQNLSKVNLCNPKKDELYEISKVIEKLLRMSEESRESIKRLEDERRDLKEKCQKSDSKILDIEMRIKSMDREMKQTQELMVEQKIEDVKRIHALENRLVKEKELAKNLEMKYTACLSHSEIERISQHYQKVFHKIGHSEKTQPQLATPVINIAPKQLLLFSGIINEIIFAQESQQPEPEIPVQQDPPIPKIETCEAEVNTDNYLSDIEHSLKQSFDKLIVISQGINYHLDLMNINQQQINLLDEINPQQIHQWISAYHNFLSQQLEAQKGRMREEYDTLRQRMVKKVESKEMMQKQCTKAITQVIGLADQYFLRMKSECQMLIEMLRVQITIQSASDPVDSDVPTIRNLQTNLDDFLHNKDRIIQQVEDANRADEDMGHQLAHNITQMINQSISTVRQCETVWADAERMIQTISYESAKKTHRQGELDSEETQ